MSATLVGLSTIVVLEAILHRILFSLAGLSGILLRIV
jgi:hypothetical protein